MSAATAKCIESVMLRQLKQAASKAISANADIKAFWPHPGQHATGKDYGYPNLAKWIRDYDGWIEIGQDEMSYSMVRVLNPGGLIWESGESYISIDEALVEADRAVATELATY